MIEGNLEVQLPTTWTDVATVGRAVREEKGREKIRDEKGRSKKIKVREKVKKTTVLHICSDYLNTVKHPK